MIEEIKGQINFEYLEKEIEKLIENKQLLFNISEFGFESYRDFEETLMKCEFSTMISISQHEKIMGRYEIKLLRKRKIYEYESRLNNEINMTDLLYDELRSKLNRQVKKNNDLEDILNQKYKEKVELQNDINRLINENTEILHENVILIDQKKRLQKEKEKLKEKRKKKTK